MGEIQNAECIEVIPLTRRKVIMKKVIALDLVIDNVIFTQQCYVLPITNPIILGSDFLDTHFSMLDMVLVLSPCIALITCLPSASPMTLYMTSA